MPLLIAEHFALPVDEGVEWVSPTRIIGNLHLDLHALEYAIKHALASEFLEDLKAILLLEVLDEMNQ